MKVLLVQVAAYGPETERSMPLGILYLASTLREQRSCRVELFDMQLKIRDAAPAVAKARTFRPDLIGLSGMTPVANAMDALAGELKKAFPSTPLVAGGAHPTNNPDKVMQNDAVDFVIVGEGEYALAGLIDHLEGKCGLPEVPNLGYRENGSVRHNDPAPYMQDLDSLPFPAYDLIDLEPYYRIPRCGVIYSHRRYAAMITSRGCPYRCAYCHQIMGKKWRPRSAPNVVDEMEQLVRDFGIREFVFMDDMFNLTPERTDQLAELILERGLKVGLSFPIGLRGDIMTGRSVRLLKKAGMFRCMYAVESASERIQKLIGKNNKLDKIKEIIDITRREGVLVHGSFMLGFPTETQAEARSTVEWAVRSRLHTAAFYRVIPYPGTELNRMAKEAGVNLPDDLEGYEFHKANVVNASLVPDAVLNRLKRQAYRRFYLSFRRLWSIFWILPNRGKMLPELFRIWIRKAFFW